jgi:hypothetical protein
MKRILYATVALGLAACALAVWVRPTTTIAQNPDPQPLPAVQAAEPLPIKQVVLFNAGVGYFLREGKVKGNARVDLTFPVTDINDLLKSMTLRDLDGGLITAVSYDSNDPVERTLRSFAINFNGQPGLANILNQARGHKVEVLLQPNVTTQPGKLLGTIVGVEKQKVAAGKDAVVEVEQLNLWCSDGLRSIKLNEVQRVQFASAALESEVRRALEVIASGSDAIRKSVSINCQGAGERRVRVGYVLESPIWKTSYRLVLPNEQAKEEQAKQPYLQGWAIVDNPSDEDWSEVGMALISSRPISFRMDLYTPLYVQRPLEKLELFASLRPQTYGGGLNQNANLAADGVALGEKADLRGAAPPMAPQAPGFGGRGGAAADRDRDEARRQAADLGRELQKQMDLGASVKSVATASQLGDNFQYFIDHTVTLPRQKSAMLPIVGTAIEAQRLSIYNPAVLAKHPLLGLRLKNTSNLHLMQGPLTIFDGGTYAGDAKILDLQPKEERLISYAIDLGTEMEVINPNQVERLTKLHIDNGVVVRTVRLRQEKVYRATNRSQTDRTIWIEHPLRHDFTLVSQTKPVEESRDMRRFELKVAAGKSGSVTVTEEKDVQTTISLSNADDGAIRVLLDTPIASEQVKKALTKAQALRASWAQIKAEREQKDRDLKEITDDQARLRANLREMPTTAEAYKRYLTKFDRQEEEIERLQGVIRTLRQREYEARTAYEAYLRNLRVE